MLGFSAWDLQSRLVAAAQLRMERSRGVQGLGFGVQGSKGFGFRVYRV